MRRGRRLAGRAVLGCAALIAVPVAGCGSSQHVLNQSRPATPINLTVYISDGGVSVSPARAGAGPVQFYITNQASSAQALTIRQDGAGTAVASTEPINPGSTAQVQVDFTQGRYRLTSGSVPAATLRIGRPRPSSDNVLLQP